MRWYRWLLLTAVASAGCAGNQSTEFPMPSTTARSGSPAARKPATVIVTPTQGRAGRIASVHPTGNFVVITFPVGVPLPPAERRLNVYRAGLKVAEVKVDARSIDVNTVADIVAGECEVGDEVREE